MGAERKAAVPGTVGAVVLCRCGCNGPATYLCSGTDYDPAGPNGRGEPFRDEPCCYSVMQYLAESSEELGFPFVVRRIDAQNARLDRPEGAAGENDGH